MLQFYSQAGGLAVEADRVRRAAIAEMFPPVSFVDPSFESSALLFAEPQAITRALPPVSPPKYHRLHLGCVIVFAKFRN